MKAYAHRKLTFSPSCLGPLAFADFYQQQGVPLEGRTLVMYIGGSISEATYMQRVHTEPLPILKAFRLACEGSTTRGVDLLVSSCPPWGKPTTGAHNPTEDRDAGLRLDRLHESFLRHLREELLPAIATPRIMGGGLVGMSMGAFLAVSLALDQPFPLCTVATIGGAGMVEALQGRQTEDLPSLQFLVAANVEDPLLEQSQRFSRYLSDRGGRTKAVRRIGIHAFVDYEANGSVLDAFRFVVSGGAVTKEG